MHLAGNDTADFYDGYENTRDVAWRRYALYQVPSSLSFFCLNKFSLMCFSNKTSYATLHGVYCLFLHRICDYCTEQ